MPQWKEIHGTLHIEEIKAFANSIKCYGEEYQVSCLIHYGQKLGEFIEAYDIEQIENTLTRFPKLVNS